MNWGNKILFVYVGFAMLMFSLVLVSINQNIDLVSSDYYAKELNFQSDISKSNNAINLIDKLKVSIENGVIQIQFPQNQKDLLLTGNILLYKPSDAKSDKIYPVKPSSGIQRIDVRNFVKGLVKVKVDWEADSVGYLSEVVLLIN